VTVYLVRHGSAGARNDTDPHDVERHLDTDGREQANRLVQLLTGRPIGRILSSPAARCQETVAPLAQDRSLDVEVNEALLEGTDIAESWEFVTWAARQQHDIALCSHGDVIPELIRRAQGRGMEVPGKSGCSKGSCWELTWSGTEFTSGKYTPLKKPLS